MDRDEVWRHTHEERRALHAILADLSPEEWATPSLCEGWAVRDVAAHVIRAASWTWPELVHAARLGRGSLARATAIDARLSARRPVAEILADYERYDGVRRYVPGTVVTDRLLDVLVHTQDVVVPLGREHAMPVEAAAVAARRAYRIRVIFPGARRRLRHLRLRATDSGLDLGRGDLVEGTTQALLLLVAGRLGPARPALSGPGLAHVS